MKGLIFGLLVIGMGCLAFGSPTELAKTEVALKQENSIDLFGNTRNLIEELAENLRKSAQQAIDAITSFTIGIQEQVKLVRDRIASDVTKLREQVSQTIQNVTDRFQNTATAVRECIDSNIKKADILFNDTVKNSLTCVDSRIDDLGKMIDDLSALAYEAINEADTSLKSMKSCTEDSNGNLLSTGTCLGRVAVQTEFKGASFIGQSGLQLARINLRVATLPASLEVCAGARLVEAGLGSAKIAVDAGTCSATSFFSTLTGNQISSW